MKKFLALLFVASIGACLFAAGDAQASQTVMAMGMLAQEYGGAGVGAGLAAGFGVVGAGIGIGLIGARSNEAVARQPEMAGRIFVNMILTAALVEGVALFAVIVGVMALGKIP